MFGVGKKCLNYIAVEKLLKCIIRKIAYWKRWTLSDKLKDINSLLNAEKPLISPLKTKQ